MTRYEFNATPRGDGKLIKTAQHSVGLFLLRGFRRRLLMPRVRPLHQLSLFIAIPMFLDFADKLS